MRHLFLFLSIFLFLSTKSQFQSGNVFVSSYCGYSLSGTWQDTINTTTSNTLSFTYDSALTSWKFIIPDTADFVEVCLVPDTNCPCLPECKLQSDTNLIFSFYFCSILGFSENEILNQVYPNPFQESFFIKSNKWNFIRLENCYKQILEVNIINNEIVAVNLPPGYYFLTLSNGLIEKRVKILKI